MLVKHQLRLWDYKVNQNLFSIELALTELTD
jgi:hypothetical protein